MPILNSSVDSCMSYRTEISQFIGFTHITGLILSMPIIKIGHSPEKNQLIALCTLFPESIRLASNSSLSPVIFHVFWFQASLPIKPTGSCLVSHTHSEVLH